MKSKVHRASCRPSAKSHVIAYVYISFAIRWSIKHKTDDKIYVLSEYSTLIYRERHLLLRNKKINRSMLLDKRYYPRKPSFVWCATAIGTHLLWHFDKLLYNVCCWTTRLIIGNLYTIDIQLLIPRNVGCLLILLSTTQVQRNHTNMEIIIMHNCWRVRRIYFFYYYISNL